jgi:hypothetical protein
MHKIVSKVRGGRRCAMGRQQKTAVEKPSQHGVRVCVEGLWGVCACTYRSGAVLLSQQALRVHFLEAVRATRPPHGLAERLGRLGDLTGSGSDAQPKGSLALTTSSPWGDGEETLRSKHLQHDTCSSYCRVRGACCVCQGAVSGVTLTAGENVQPNSLGSDRTVRFCFISSAWRYNRSCALQGHNRGRGRGGHRRPRAMSDH